MTDRERFREDMIALGGLAVGGDYVLTPSKGFSRFILTLDGVEVAEISARSDLYVLADITRSAIKSWQKRCRADAAHEKAEA